MWQIEKKDSVIVSLALLLALATTPMAAPLFVSTPVLAQSATDAPSFPLPQTVENGTTVRIDGSISLAAINQSLKRSFEQQFFGTNVEVAANGADVAIQALLDGTVDVVAIARGLTPQEQAQGLEQVPIHREKIAIIVGVDNPFQGSLTDRQFARIFRGGITDWSQLGAPGGKIRVIDRPATSDTRNTFRTYPAFKAAQFSTGSNATQLDEDDTAEIVKQLGNDGISYAMAHHVSKLPNVRVIPLEQALPDDPQYLYSQPLVYAYRKNPSPSVASFLGFTLAPPGQQAIEEGRIAEAEAIARGESQTSFLVTNPTPDATTSVAQQPSDTPPLQTTSSPRQIPIWWFLLPAAGIGGLLVWFFRSRLWATESANNMPNLPSGDGEKIATNDTNVAPAVSEPPAEATSNAASLVAGSGAVISSTVSGTGADNNAPNEVTNLNNYTEINSYDFSESPWDIEAPAAVVNTSYPQIPDVSKVTPPADSDMTEVKSNEEYQHISGELTAEQHQVESDLIEDITKTTSVAGDAVAGANVWSNIEETSDTTEFSHTHEIISPVAEEKTSNVEPTPTVTTSQSTFPDIPEDTLNIVADAAEPIDYVTGSNLSQETGVGTWANISGNQDNTESEEQAYNTGNDPLLNIEGERSITLKPRNPQWAYATWYIEETCQQALQNAGISQLALRLYDVTDLDLSYQTPQLVKQYEIESGITEHYLEIPTSDRDYIAEIGYITEGDRWMTIARSPRARVFSLPLATDDPLLNIEGERSITLKPRNPQWAYATWYIEETCQQALQNAGISQLALRLYDVTDLDLSYQTPQLVKQYEIESGITEHYLEIPTSDRDYIAEIGYITEGDRWVTIARSSRVRVFSLPLAEITVENPPTADETSVHLHNPDEESSIILKPRTAKWAYTAWHIAETSKQALRNAGIYRLSLRLYDVTDLDLSYHPPQLLQQYECEEITRDRYVAIPTSDRDYIAEIGYVTAGDRWETIARSPRVRVFSRPQADFWFVADAELIIHGATEPGATVTVGGNPITLKSDGSFHLRVPFSDNLIDYLMTAIAANGTQTKTIHKKFSQEESES
ncbi:MAG: DUF4912 domain-containing protein [Trichormus sp. ATA11-4-KO1]|jgi:phosphate transport system substrate-binding protein|nr:DUF4912 domain-containing protein [Trichormus sp. ATA11-4-KO1]